jgi:hypothetical protein
VGAVFRLEKATPAFISGSRSLTPQNRLDAREEQRVVGA